jgi:uncharacterized protein YcbK (DUF882 family)
MLPVLTIAALLISNAADIAKMVLEQPAKDAELTLYFQNRQETERFTLLDGSRGVRPDALRELSHFVRCWRTGREKPMHPRTVEIVAAMAAHFQVDRVEIVSGYRARPFGAPHSRHFLGRAMDIHVPGIRAKKIAAWLWQNFRHVGVGYYPKQDFVHIDTREEDVRWVDTSSHGESAHARYTPRDADEALPADAPRLAYDTPVVRPAGLDLQLALAQSDVH